MRTEESNIVFTEVIYDVAELKQFVKQTGIKAGERQYLREQFLGSGTLSQCYVVRQQDNNQIFAAKIIDKLTLSKPSVWRRIHEEIKINVSVA